jgi:TetR/AcrR family transcriptional regulator, tetracycline repressor protein
MIARLAGITSAAPRPCTARAVQVVFGTLPTVRYPRLVECAAPMTACDDPDFHYQLGTEMFIAGVQAMADKVRR